MTVSESPHVPITPVPAASVILIRHPSLDSGQAEPGISGAPIEPAFEVFMARRHIKSDFAPDVYVFPGGKADAGDAVDGEHLLLPKMLRLKGRGEPAAGWRAIVMAALRELFEESGLLLATDAGGAWAPLKPGLQDRLAAYRDRVRSSALSMVELAATEGLVFRGDHLYLFSNWVTPEVLTRRFDTFFFLARLPEGAEARLADEVELTHSLWISPSAALERFRSGDFPLVFATERHLQRLAAYRSLDDLWTATSRSVVEPVSPRWYMRQGERVFVIPGDDGYAEARTR